MTQREYRAGVRAVVPALAPNVRHQFRAGHLAGRLLLSRNGDMAVTITDRGPTVVRVHQHKGNR